MISRKLFGLQLVLFGALAACSQLESPSKPCDSADDCPPPLVCCSNMYYISLNNFSGPTCSVRWECPNEYLPFLPEGAPCGRGGDRVNGDDCRSGTYCCPASLTCERDEVCTAKTPMETVPEPVASIACLADSDCSTGMVCCGISYSDRDGTCRPIGACGAENGISVPMPRPDAGVDTPDGGEPTSLAAQICDEAYCDENGPRAPTQAEKTRCLDYLSNGEYRTNQRCLDAVRATRPICQYALRHRTGVDTTVSPPVLPAFCKNSLDSNDETAVAACRKLGRCGLLGGVDEELCGVHLAGVGYEALSWLAEPGCDLPIAQLGWAPPEPASRCQREGDCPFGWLCRPNEVRHGICTKGCSSDNDCPGARCLDNVCVARCDPTAADAATAERQCTGRVNLSGAFDLGCQQRGNSTNSTSGVCGPFVEEQTCNGQGIERPVFEALNYPAGLECAGVAQGNVPLFGRCNNTRPEACAEGWCVDGFQTCATPCLVGAATCSPTQQCVSDYEGLGTIGGCFERCDGGTPCPNGLTCNTTFRGSRVCMP